MLKEFKIDFQKYPLPRRVRHHTSANFYIPAEELISVPHLYPALHKSLDWSERFANAKAPNMLDIGCGRGLFLLSFAYNFPELNCLGIEVRDWPVTWLNNFCKCEAVPNVSAVHYSVVNGIPFIEDNSIESVFYLFPDPWPKTRHLKRRAFNQRFLSEVFRVLKPGGKLYLATDMEIVHEHHKEELDEFGKMKYKIIDSDEDWQFPHTNKELFCRKEGIAFFRLIVEK